MTKFPLGKKKKYCIFFQSYWFTTSVLQKYLANIKEMGLCEILLQFSSPIPVKQQNCSQYFANIRYFLHFNFTGVMFS